MKPIAHIHSDFATKFGIPRQSGVVGSLQAEIVFEPEFRSRDAVRGLEAFSHIWLIWEFSENVRADWSPTVRPPRLGGNVRMGVFATRSPFRPNPIGLSCVRLEDITFSDARGPVLHVAGADLMDGTPIYDIKPYLPDGMKLMAMGPGGVLENAMALTGYDNMCYMLYEEPELLEAIFREVGSRLVRYYQLAAQYDHDWTLIPTK